MIVVMAMVLLATAMHEALAWLDELEPQLTVSEEWH